ncbi:hypothetical protein Glove_365g100 [Diversispora epigaea]|uniref:RanBD1 domain-containing protein n=1 Tax=Diversispora epigaea TaxID=1348612 RepID=A0A397HCL1_9GLOM|nr:hypothetical protein Glove_365g100 [Diversispora epigaea]
MTFKIPPILEVSIKKEVIGGNNNDNDRNNSESNKTLENPIFGEKTSIGQNSRIFCSGCTTGGSNASQLQNNNLEGLTTSLPNKQPSQKDEKENDKESGEEEVGKGTQTLLQEQEGEEDEIMQFLIRAKLCCWNGRWKEGGVETLRLNHPRNNEKSPQLGCKLVHLAIKLSNPNAADELYEAIKDAIHPIQKSSAS